MWTRWWSRKPNAKSEESGGTFATNERAEQSELTPEDDELLERITSAVVRFRMTVPAIFLLESSKPLNFVGSQFLHFLSPIAHSVLDARELDRLAALLERRDTIEVLIRRIEAAETAAS